MSNVFMGFPQADFNQTDNTQLNYIKNKPSIGALAAKDSLAYDELTDKPFGDETHEPLSISAETIENYEVLDISGVSYVKVSDEILTKDQVLGGRVEIFGDGVLAEGIDIDESLVDDSIDGCLAIANGAVMSLSVTEIRQSGLSLVFPSTGTYINVVELILAAQQGMNVEIRLTFPSQVKKLDEKFIPNTIARTSELESKVDKVEGKGLSTNDYTDDDKAKVDSLGALATKDTLAYDELTDKPFGEETHEPLVWDGNTEGRELYDSGNYIMCKISDEVFTAEQLIGGTLKLCDTNTGEIIDIPITVDEIKPLASGTGICCFEYFFISTTDTKVADTITLPSIGTYLGKMTPVGPYTSEITFPSQVKKIDEKYIPDTIARTSDLDAKLDSSALTTAVNDALAQAKASGEFDGADGVQGADGAKGEDGVGISSVQQTTTSTEDDGNNIVTVTLTDGTTSTFTVQNGSKGADGAKGDTGPAGATPVRGTDYWTEADKAEIKAYVDDAILNGEW